MLYILLKRNNIKIGLLFFAIFLFSDELWSQYEQKYWNYRERFRKYFTYIGSGQGESLVSNRRNGEGAESGSNKMLFGDQTTNLGDYIAMLAMEYKILSEAGQSVNQTAKELYYALYAFNRLDLVAESHLGYPPNLNGFFIRDDVYDGTDFVSNHPDLNNGLSSPIPPNDYVDYVIGSGSVQWVEQTASRITNSNFQLPTQCKENKDDDIDGDFDDQEDFRSTDLPSPDQIAGLYFGMAMVVKCVPSSATYNNLPLNDADGNIYFVDAARNITDRITTWMQSHDWKIKSPAGCSLWGEPAGMRYAFGVAAGEIMGNPDKYKDITFNGIDWCGLKYAWNNCNNFLSEWEFCDIEYNAKIVMLLAAIGNSWECIFDNKSTYQSILDISSNWNNWQYFYPLIYTILHSGTNTISQNAVEALLNFAPDDGPYNHGGVDFAMSGWCTPFLFRANNDEQQGAVNSFGNYHGLDYMLLYNLYRIIYFPPPTCDATADLLITSGGTVPAISNYLPNATISAKNTIVTSGNVTPLPGQTWRAGDRISLNPGFRTLPGQAWAATPGDCVELFERLGKTDTAKHKGGETDTVVQKGTQPELYTSILKNTQEHNLSKGEQPNDNSPKSNQKSENQNLQSTINNQQSAITISPNPSADGKFNVECTIQEVGCMNAEISVMNALGQTIHSEPLNHYNFPVSIDLSSQPKGTYFVKIASGEKNFVLKAVSK